MLPCPSTFADRSPSSPGNRLIASATVVLRIPAPVFASSLTLFLRLSSLSVLSLPESLGRYPQSPVELAGGVLPGDHRRKLDHGVFVEDGPHVLEELVIDVPIGEGDGVGVLQRDLLRLLVERARGVLFEGQD